MTWLGAIVLACAAALAGWTIGRRIGYDAGQRDGAKRQREYIARLLSGPE